MSWLGILFLTACCLLVADTVSGFGFFFPRQAPFLRGCGLMAGIVLSVIALIQGLRAPVVETHEVRLRGLPESMDGTVIVGLSDLHIGSMLGARWLAARIAQVRAQRPDLVVLLGDIFEGHGMPSSRELLSIMRELTAPLGVWAVQGNHESYGRNRGLALLKASGSRVLYNQWIEVRPGLVLAGVEDLTTHRRAGRQSDPVAQALAGRPSGVTILLSHTPWQAEEAAELGVGLMLAGHTHGGQIWPFSYLVRRVYPLFAGRYDVNGMTAIVCRGTGTWGPRMRLWPPGEILRVVLRRAE